LASVLTFITAAARCIFPLGFGRKLATEPMRVGNRILISDLNDGVVLLALLRPYLLLAGVSFKLQRNGHFGPILIMRGGRFIHGGESGDHGNPLS
jgi:hypothetical protein